jgi:hypothetical protein
MSSKNLLFFGDVAGRVVPAARPATQRSPRWASLQLPQKGQVV